MSDEIKIESKNKLNKKLLIGVTVLIAIALVAVFIIFVPKSANARNLEEQLSLGAKYLSELEYEQAEAAYLAAIEIDPKNVDAYLGLADVYIAQDEYDKAEEVLENALDKVDEDAVDAVKEKLEEVRAKKVEEVTPTPDSKPINAPTSIPMPTPTLVPDTSVSTNTSVSIATSIPKPTATSTPVPTVTPIPETPAEYFEWEENEDGTLTLIGFLQQGWGNNEDGTLSWVGNADSPITEIKIPAEVNGKKVTVIGNGAFMYEYYLENIILPEGIREISDDAFYGCDEVENINIPSTVTSIGSQAFGRIYEIEEIVIPKNVQKIGVGVFEGCMNLRDITVDEGNENYCSKDGVLFSKNGEVLLQMPPNKEIEKYEIPQGVTTIGDSAFYMNNSIQEVIIPNTVGHIGYNAFWCAELESTFIPASVEQIDSGAFGSFGNTFKEFCVDENNPYYCSEDGVLYSKDKTILYEMVVRDKTSFTVPEGVIRISDSAFEYNEVLQTVIISDTVEEIGGLAFGYCNTLEKVVLSKNLRRIEWQAFFYCENLTSIMIPDSVVDIGFYGFEGCENLIVKASSGSYAEQYAIENGISVEKP